MIILHIIKVYCKIIIHCKKNMVIKNIFFIRKNGNFVVIYFINSKPINYGNKNDFITIIFFTKKKLFMVIKLLLIIIFI